MVRYKILDKDISLTTQSDKRLEIQIISEKDKKIIHKHESGKYTGKFSLTIEKSIINII